jgi:hypothetical protein
MKRAGGLWEKLVSFENLHEAARRAALGKKKRADVAAFLLNLEPELVSLERELRSGEYRPGPYRQFWVTEAKPRLISAAPFRDRVAHHALTQVLEPVFERRFSFRRRMRDMQQAFREGKMGWEQMRPRVQAWIGHAAHGNTWRLREQLFSQFAFGKGSVI